MELLNEPDEGPPEAPSPPTPRPRAPLQRRLPAAPRRSSPARAHCLLGRSVRPRVAVRGQVRARRTRARCTRAAARGLRHVCCVCTPGRTWRPLCTSATGGPGGSNNLFKQEIREVIFKYGKVKKKTKMTHDPTVLLTSLDIKKKCRAQA